VRLYHTNEEKTRSEQDKRDYRELKIIEVGMERKFGLPAILILRDRQTDRQTVGEGGLEFGEIQTFSVLRRRTALWVTHNKETFRSEALTARGS